MLYTCSVKRILIKRSGLHERNLPNAIQKHRIHGQKKGLMTKFKLHESFTVNMSIYMHFRHNQTTTTTTTKTTTENSWPNYHLNKNTFKLFADEARRSEHFSSFLGIHVPYIKFLDEARGVFFQLSSD